MLFEDHVMRNENVFFQEGDEEKASLYMNMHGKTKEMFDCEKCDYPAKTAHTLQLHIGAKHDNVRFTCEHCDFSSG